MHTILFRLQTLLRCLRAHKSLTVASVLTMAVGLFFPAVILSGLNYALTALQLLENPNMDNLAYLDFYMPLLEEEELEAALLSASPEALAVGTAPFLLSAGCTWQQQTLMQNLQGFSRDFFSLERYRLYTGRMPTDQEIENSAPLCLLAYGSSLYNAGVRPGHTIEVRGQALEVIGIIIAPKLYGNLFTPYGVLYGMAAGASLQHQAYYQTLQPPNTYALRGALNASLPGEAFLYEVMTAREYYSLVNAVSYGAYIRASGAEGALLLAFSLVAIVMVIVGRTLETRYTIGVKLAQGATRKSIMWDCVLESLAFALVALLLDMAALLLLRGWLSEFYSILLSGRLLLWLLLLAAAVAACTGGLAGLVATRGSITGIVRGAKA